MAHTKESIVEAAIKILNRDGIDGLSMRILARELDIKAAALYWHFEGKRELYGAIAEYLCTQYYINPSAADAAVYLLQSYHSYRAMLLTVRDSPVIFENSIPTTPRRAEIVRLLSAKLLETGVSPNNLMTISNMLNNYVLSFVADEVRLQNTTPEVMRTLAEALDPEDKLTFMSERDFNEQFDLGLRVMFAGLAIICGHDRFSC